MLDDLSGLDAKQVWQHQTEKDSTMTLEVMEWKAKELHAKNRRELFSNIALTLITVVIAAFGMLRTHAIALQSAFVLAVLWALAGQYFVGRGLLTPILPSDAASATGLDFYRRELIRQRSLLRLLLQWSFGPVVLSIATLILVLTGIAERLGLSFRAVLPFGTCFAIWIVAFLIRRSQRHQYLKRELDELTAFDKNSSQ